MKPLFILLITFVLSILISRLIFGQFDFKLSGKIALDVMLIFTAIGHFILTKGMTMMLPDFVPFRTELIYLTGILEIAAAVGIFFPSLRWITGCCLILFFILILPSNIYAAWKGIDYQTGNLGGNGLSYLWFRIPFQVLLIAWTYFFVVR